MGSIDRTGSNSYTICTSSTRPASPIAGSMIFETDTNTLQLYSGSAWVQIGPLTSAWTAFTPTLSGGWALGNATYTATYMRVGRKISFGAYIVIGTSTTKGSVMIVALPVTAASQYTAIANFTAYFLISASGHYPAFAISNSTSTVELVTPNSAGTYTIANQTQAAVPATWATGDIIRYGGTYEAAS